MKKDLTYSKENRAKLREGVEKLSRTVGLTLGPKGRTVLIETAYGGPHPTKDGVTVANAVVLEDAVENLGAQLVKQAAAKTVQQAGDGTTTSIVLASSMIKEAIKEIESGASPVNLKKGMEVARNILVQNLQNDSEDIKDNWDRIQQVATVSANNDKYIGELIRKAREAVGSEGVVAAQDSKSTETFIKVSDGMSYDRGYISPYFINKHDKRTCELENVLILMYDKKIRAQKDIVSVMEIAAQKGQPLLVICEDVESQALVTMLVNRTRANFPIVATKAPGYGDRRRLLMEDIAAVTGGTYVSEKATMPLSDVTIEELGHAERVVVSAAETTIINGSGDPVEIAQRLDEARIIYTQAESDYDKEKTAERISKLQNGVAVIHVGAHTEAELKEKKDRIDDALKATKAALEEGILPGGGMALYNYNLIMSDKSIDKDYVKGAHIVYNACKVPFYKICENAGKNSELVSSKLKKGKGYNALTDKYEDLKESGIVDPTKVVRAALENAVSVAGTLIMTEASITEQGNPETGNMDIDHGPQF